MTAYNHDETDPSGYDLVINLDQIDPAEAVKTITNAAEYLKFQPMTYSIKCLSDLALAAKVNVRLLKHMVDINVQARDGSVVVLTKASNRQKEKKIAAIKDLAGSIEGIRYVEVHVKKNILGGNGWEFILRRKFMSKLLEVLLLDDEPIVGRRLKPALDKIGCHVEIFENPREAVARIDQKGL